MDKKLRPFLAEFFGTFALVFLSAGAVCAAQLPRNVLVSTPLIALAEGLALAVTLSATTYLAGGYLNPAVTITLWVLRRLDNIQTAGFLIAQLIAAALAGLVLRLLFSSEVLILAHYGVPHVTEAFGELTVRTIAAAAGVEVLLTFVLTFVIFATMIDPRAPRIGGLAVGLIAGLALATLTLIGYDLTGAAVNPARCLGTVVWEWASQPQPPSLREQVIVYWIGPIVGALLAGLAYTYLILPPEEAPS